MKKLLLLTFTLVFFAMSAMAGKATTLTVEYLFYNINEGYDHVSKGKLYIDGNLVHETDEHLESELQKFTIKTTPGNHDILLEMWSLYEGEWELHTVDNNYSIDCIVDDTFKLKPGKNKLVVKFDLDDDTSYELK
jgi:hypothetical protein